MGILIESQLVSVILITIIIAISKALKCYDSQSAKPERVNECNNNELCYSEYYSLKASKHLSQRLGGTPIPLIHFYDRFCVHEQHCRHRGLNPNSDCLNVHDLDPIVRNTFYEKLRRERLDRRRLKYSRFCCCNNKDKCNDLSAESITQLYNISTKDTARHRGRKTPSNDFNQSINIKNMTLLAQNPCLIALCVFVFILGIYL